MAERLIVRKFSPKPSVVERAAETIIKRPATRQVVVDEVTVSRPTRFSLFRRNHAGIRDRKAIQAAVDSLRTSLSEDASRFEVVRKTDGKKPKEKRIKGWQQSVNAERKHELRKLKREERKRAHRSVEAEARIHAVETRALVAVGEMDEVKGSARALTTVVLGTPNAVIPHRMRPGRHESLLQHSMYGVYVRLQDGVLDPMNVFHGAGEAIAQRLKQIQTGPYRVLFNLFLAAHPRLNQGVAGVLNFNKFTSRDTLPSKAYVAAYSAFYERMTNNTKTFIALPNLPLFGRIKVTRGEAWAAVLPSPAQIENAADSHMSFADKASAIQAHDVLSRPINTKYGRLYRRDVAQAVLGSLNTVPLDNKLTYTLEKKMGELVSRVNSLTGGAISKIPNPFPKLMEFAGLKPKTEKKKKGASSTDAEKAQAAARDAQKNIENALREQMSIIDYTKLMLQLSQTYLTIPNLKPNERVKWEQAYQWGTYVVETYNLAEQVASQRRTAAQNSPAEK